MHIDLGVAMLLGPLPATLQLYNHTHTISSTHLIHHTDSVERPGCLERTPFPASLLARTHTLSVSSSYPS